jgi:hypothetical protein
LPRVLIRVPRFRSCSPVIGFRSWWWGDAARPDMGRGHGCRQIHRSAVRLAELGDGGVIDVLRAERGRSGLGVEVRHGVDH